MQSISFFLFLILHLSFFPHPNRHLFHDFKFTSLLFRFCSYLHMHLNVCNFPMNVVFCSPSPCPTYLSCQFLASSVFQGILFLHIHPRQPFFLFFDYFSFFYLFPHFSTLPKYSRSLSCFLHFLSSLPDKVEDLVVREIKLKL